MVDVQGQPDGRRITIDKVGVKDVHYPIVLLDRRNERQHTNARINMYVSLPHNFKGTHMSRFLEILNEYRGEITMGMVPTILREMREKLRAEAAHIEIQFEYFIEKEAPVSKARSLQAYNCRFVGVSNEREDFILGVEVPVTTCCPCSKAISEQGAHNQRSLVTVQVRSREFVWIEDLVRLVESCGSAEIFPLVKREDEKALTEEAYGNPKFVEDVVRDVARLLAADRNILWFSVESENLESIHSHNAYAAIERDRRPLADRPREAAREEAHGPVSR